MENAHRCEPESPVRQPASRPPKKDGPARLPKHSICINLSDAKYDVIHHVCQKMLGWQVVTNDENNMHCDIIWNDTACNQDLLGRLKSYQKLNHFPGIFSIARKNFLCFHLNKMRKAFPEAYRFFPRSFNLPVERHLLAKEIEERKKSQTYIVKPEALSMGRGIFLIKRVDDIPANEPFVAQKYVAKPFLIDGLKFDLRIYVLVTSVAPLRIYIYREGLARFATETYAQPDSRNMKNMCQHLTNYSVNKHSRNFKFDANPMSAESGHKRCLAAIWKHMDANGFDSKTVWQNIKASVIKTICSIQPILKHAYTACQPNDVTTGMCFELLGFDILVKQSLKVNVLEVNHAPSFNTDTPYDFRVKSTMLKNMFDILHVTVDQRNGIIEREQRVIDDRFLTGVRRKVVPEERERERLEYRKDLDFKIRDALGDFEQIYPTTELEEPFEEYMKHAETILLQKTGVVTDKSRRREAQSQQRKLHNENRPLNTQLDRTAPAQTEALKHQRRMQMEKIQEAVNRLYSKKQIDIEQAQKERTEKLKTLDDLMAKKYEAIKTNIVTLEFLPNMR
jgi:tubulin polyglutamylase TTLL6/13